MSECGVDVDPWLTIGSTTEWPQYDPCPKDDVITVEITAFDGRVLQHMHRSGKFCRVPGEPR